MKQKEEKILGILAIIFGALALLGYQSLAY